MKKLSLIMGLTLLALISSQCLADENTISACYKKNNGQLRLVYDPSECKKSELPISWSINSGESKSSGDAGTVHVYDAMGQYLGILLDNSASGSSFQSVKIYVPEIQKTISISPYTKTRDVLTILKMVSHILEPQTSYIVVM
jgi:hypothetical protein